MLMMGEALPVWGQELYGESFFSYAVNLKLLFKK